MAITWEIRETAFEQMAWVLYSAFNGKIEAEIGTWHPCTGMLVLHHCAKLLLVQSSCFLPFQNNTQFEITLNVVFEPRTSALEIGADLFFKLSFKIFLSVQAVSFKNFLSVQKAVFFVAFSIFQTTCSTFCAAKFPMH